MTKIQQLSETLQHNVAKEAYYKACGKPDHAKDCHDLATLARQELAALTCE